MINRNSLKLSINISYKRIILIFLISTGFNILNISYKTNAQVPANEGGYWYRGNTHTHAQFSDENDKNDVPKIAGWYRDAGYNFLCLSEHNDHVVQKKIFCHDEASIPPDFIMLCGNELSETRHHLALGINSFIGNETSLQDGVTKTIAAGGVPILNHPQDPVVKASDFIATKGLNHLEILNGGRPEDTPATELLWDSILSAPDGRIVYAVAADDNHYKKANVGRGWIMVRAQALTKSNILENIRIGNFYATSGIILNDFNLTDKTLTVSTVNGETIIFIGKNGTVLKTVKSSKGEYQIKGDEKYVRVKITNADGKMAWTQPVSVKSLTGDWETLIKGAEKTGKPEWQPMLKYVAELHKRSTHPAAYPFNYEWEEIGPGYIYGPAFGHWDIVHQTLDVMNFYPEHALHQLLNDINNQEPTGMLPGSIYLPGEPSGRDSVNWSKLEEGHPPLWVQGVQDYIDQTGDKTYLKDFYTSLVRQLTWFENNRKAENEGFFYNDILLKRWESGVDEGIRFDNTGMGKWACIDATCHVYQLYHFASLWSEELGIDSRFFKRRESELLDFIQNKLYSKDRNMFFDIWAIKDPSLQNIAFENLWPMIVGAATKEQTDKLIDLYISNPDVFLTEHPVSTVGKNDPKFELRMWRGPAWNSMTYWVARGCLSYGRNDAAKILLEKALDDSAEKFKDTGTIWEFYNSLGGSPQDVKRKPQTKKNEPCIDYLGHNPLIAMALMYDKIK